MYHLIDKSVRGEEAHASFSPSQVRFLQASLTEPMNQKILAQTLAHFIINYPFSLSISGKT